jgi:hypothetical protein
MKIRTSYFYQIRFFKENMIPISTRMWDPKWYHRNLGHEYNYLDKRGIINGLRYEDIIVQGNTQSYCPCAEKDPTKCAFLRDYHNELEKLNFPEIMAKLEDVAQRYQKWRGLEEEPIIVFIVYEVPKNPCSERVVLQKWFQEHGVDCTELKYPIQENVE